MIKIFSYLKQEYMTFKPYIYLVSENVNLLRRYTLLLLEKI